MILLSTPLRGGRRAVALSVSTQVADNFFEHMNSAFPADRLASCMVEDRHVAAARARASQRVERLENALDVIKALPA